MLIRTQDLSFAVLGLDIYLDDFRRKIREAEECELHVE